MIKEQIVHEPLDMKRELLEQLNAVVPEVFSEGKLDLEKLHALIGEANKPACATLIADREESISFDDAQHIFIKGENLEVLKLLYKAASSKN